MAGTGMRMGLTIVLAAGVSTACATKGFVTESIANRATEVDKRVTAVEQTVDDLSGATRTNAARIGEVDLTANKALDDSASAGTRADGAQTSASEALGRTGALEAAHRQLLFEVVLTEDHGRFGFAKAAVPDTAAASLDELVARLLDEPAAVHLEIAGHTDQTGPSAYNMRLGLERAESVRRYLYEHHNVPLHKINVISYGEDKPIAPNDTAEGRAQNRRVVVRVLSGDAPGNGQPAATNSLEQ